MITHEVKREIIDKPLTIKRFELQAMMLEKLLSEKVLELPESIGIKDREINAETERFVSLANSIFESRGRGVKILSKGESSCLALNKILQNKGVKSVIVVDERTIRILVEKPENLKNLMERKLHLRIKMRNENFKEFKNFKFIRSAELMYLAYKKRLIDLKKGDVLDALLWALKSHGCAITSDEIEEIKRLG